MLSSGTWSLLGLELPRAGAERRRARGNLTNERGIDGHDAAAQEHHGAVAAQESRRGWDATLLRRAEPARRGSGTGRSAVRPRRRRVPAPRRHARPHRRRLRAHRPARAATASARPCAASSSRSPASTAGRSSGSRRSAAATCAASTSSAAARATRCCAGSPPTCCGREVLAGPVEATALGNVLVQARGAGELGSLAELREVAAASAEPGIHEPSGRRRDLRTLPGRHRPPSRGEST